MYLPPPPPKLLVNYEPIVLKVLHVHSLVNSCFDHIFLESAADRKIELQVLLYNLNIVYFCFQDRYNTTTWQNILIPTCLVKTPYIYVLIKTVYF